MWIKTRLIMPTLLFGAAILTVLAACVLSLVLQPAGRASASTMSVNAMPMLTIDTRAASETLAIAFGDRVSPVTDR